MNIDEQTAFISKWNECQVAIFQELLLLHPIKGAEIKRYNLRDDAQAGAYLEIDFRHCWVEIDLEDVKTIEEYRERGVVQIFINHKPTEEDPERGEFFDHGFVETIEEAAVIVDLLRRGEFEDAMRLLFRLRYSKELRTPEQIEAMVQRAGRE